MLRSKNLAIILISFGALLLLLSYFYFSKIGRVERISLTQLEDLANNLNIKKASLKDSSLFIKSDKGTYEVFASDKALNLINKKTFIHIENSIELLDLFILFCVISILLIFLLQYKKSKKPMVIESKEEKNEFALVRSEGFKLDQIIGQDLAKRELRLLLMALQNHAEVIKLNIRLPKGILLCGPSGTGKTLAAKALASEVNASYFYQSASSFNEIYVGVGSKRIRELFAEARKRAPSIIFIDEIDALGRARGSLLNTDSESTLNELLVQMDGFTNSGEVIVLAATNREDSLDAALLRSGRFDKRIHFTLPNEREREKLLDFYLKDFAPHSLSKPLAALSASFTGADFSNFANELKYLSLVQDEVDFNDALKLLSNIKKGFRQPLELSEKDAGALSFYQAAKAYMAYILGYKIIYVDMQDLFYIQQNSSFTSRHELLCRLKVLLAGASATEIFFQTEYEHKDALEIKELLLRLSYFSSELELEQLKDESKELLLPAKAQLSSCAALIIKGLVMESKLLEIFSMKAYDD